MPRTNQCHPLTPSPQQGPVSLQGPTGLSLMVPSFQTTSSTLRQLSIFPLDYCRSLPASGENRRGWWDSRESTPRRPLRRLPCEGLLWNHPDRCEEWCTRHGSRVECSLPQTYQQVKGKIYKTQKPQSWSFTQSLFCERTLWAPHSVSKAEIPCYLQFLLKELSIFGCFFFLISPFHLLSQGKHLWFINAWRVNQCFPVQTSRGHIKQ